MCIRDSINAEYMGTFFLLGDFLEQDRIDDKNFDILMKNTTDTLNFPDGFIENVDKYNKEYNVNLWEDFRQVWILATRDDFYNGAILASSIIEKINNYQATQIVKTSSRDALIKRLRAAANINYARPSLSE
eukprot:TRINITY_DN1162_c0_g2_i3.p1 TRINITY_DN1162_c0_g2~~TRINITY_DN1162_c0_g2_i3.p1  ORF type:complete len:131 (-),score=33.11 TRINITY_DN1162_c0_g2_i3:156-548(-)